MATKAQIKAVDKYNKAKTVMYCLRFFKETDKTVIEKLNSVPNRTDYIRQLILADINK